jgi:hypothetical protein
MNAVLKILMYHTNERMLGCIQPSDQVDSKPGKREIMFILFIYLLILHSSDPCKPGAHRVLNLSHLELIQGYLQKEIGYKKEIKL